MKIGYIITGLGMGGAEKHLLKFLPEVKYDKFIISLTKNKSIGRKIEKKGIKVYYLNTNYINFPIQILKLIKILKNEKPNILDSYLIHANLICRFIGKYLNIPVINSVRNDYSYSKIYSWLDRLTSPLVSMYTPNSFALKDYLNKIKIPSSKIEVVNNFIISDELKNPKNIRHKYNISKNSKVFICVARFVEQKNHKLLINTFNEYLKEDTNAKLFLCGGGPLLNHFKIKEKNNKNIIFTNTVKSSKNFIHSSDIFILPSKREGMSNALMEAMFLGKTCFVSNIKPNTQLINLKTGYIFSNKNQLLSLMRKKSYSNYKKSNSKNLIQKKYTLNKTLERYYSIINRYI
tara:strand:+ start:438 stop:1478 length:1041 start_codon:yes stop_codon:yes gene_type:complete